MSNLLSITLFLEPTVTIVPHYSGDNTLIKVIVRGINLRVGAPPIAIAQCMQEYYDCVI